MAVEIKLVEVRGIALPATTVALTPAVRTPHHYWAKRAFDIKRGVLRCLSCGQRFAARLDMPYVEFAEQTTAFFVHRRSHKRGSGDDQGIQEPKGGEAAV